MMPNTEGLGILYQLKDNNFTANVPIIISSILDREQQVLELGARAFIKKPVLRSDLLPLLEEIL